MNRSLSEKERLLSTLTEIYGQLEELELVLETSFSDLRLSLNKEEHEKLKVYDQRLSELEMDFEKRNTLVSQEETRSNQKQAPRSFKLELGF